MQAGRGKRACSEQAWCRPLCCCSNNASRRSGANSVTTGLPAEPSFHWHRTRQRAPPAPEQPAARLAHVPRMPPRAWRCSSVEVMGVAATTGMLNANSWLAPRGRGGHAGSNSRRSITATPLNRQHRHKRCVLRFTPQTAYLCCPHAILNLRCPPIEARLPLGEQPLALRNLSHRLRLELRLPSLQRLLLCGQLVGLLLQWARGRAKAPTTQAVRRPQAGRGMKATDTCPEGEPQAAK